MPTSHKQLIERFSWSAFNYRDREFEPVPVQGLVAGIWGIWLENPCTGFEHFSVTHLPTGFAMTRTDTLEEAVGLVDHLRNEDKAENPWQPDAEHLQELGQLVRPTDGPREIVPDWRSYWHCNRPGLLTALDAEAG